VDTVLVRFEDQQPEIVSSLCVAYPEPLAERLRQMIGRHLRPSDDEMLLMDHELAEFFALSAWGLLDHTGLKAKDILAIGSHGQTVWHNPVKPKPETIQLGDPQHIANLTGIPTVSRFRQADLQAGGQGAPLAPLLHGALFKPEKGVCAVLNLGGIANISVLDHNGTISGYDTGPGNCLLDHWVRKHKGTDFDDGGQWAAGGNVDETLLDLLLADPYFALPPPKSTGVEYFNYYWLRSRLDGRRPDAVQASLRDIQTTLSELTARTSAEAVKSASAEELLVCGGGSHNHDVLKRLQRLLPDTRVNTTAIRGMDPDLVEGVLFAWLARERIAGRAQDTRRITGAREAVLLGEIFDPV
ncbi:MAG: anhydro-N-acetylmuramic acid kinase, partial [Lysobacterales bacterium]